MKQRRKPRNIAEAIRAARDEREWSRAKLARMLEVPEATIENWENGRTEPRFALYARMSLLFGWGLPYSEGTATRVKLNGIALGLDELPVAAQA